ncbi:MAG: hypothetical protein K2X74_20625, partial [Acetobacteraceae bacterium]|nr:hypothetical protein [Acetobacteraceae bacterium]
MAGSIPASATADAAPDTAAAPADAVAARRISTSPGRDAWRRFRRHKLAMASSVILGVIIFGVLLGPFVWTVPIDEINFAARLKGPSWEHPFGTDDLGQDMLARMLYGGR